MPCHTQADKNTVKDETRMKDKDETSNDRRDVSDEHELYSM